MALTTHEARLNELRVRRDRNGELLASTILNRVEELLVHAFDVAIIEITAVVEPGDFGEPGFTLHKVRDDNGSVVWDIDNDDTFDTLPEIESLLDEMGALNPSDYEADPEWTWAFGITSDDEYVNVALTVQEIGRLLGGGVVLADVDAPEGVGHPDALGTVSVLVRLAAPQED